MFRDFSDVGRVVEAYLQLVSEPIDPDTINICSGHSVHLTDIPKILEEISGRTIEVITDPSLARGNEPHVIGGSPSRLERLVGPLPTRSFERRFCTCMRHARGRLVSLDSRVR